MSDSKIEGMNCNKISKKIGNVTKVNATKIKIVNFLIVNN